MSQVQLKYRYNWTLVICTFFFIICAAIFYFSSTTQFINILTLSRLSGDPGDILFLRDSLGVAFGFNIFFGTVFLIAGAICGIERARTKRFELY